MRYTIGRDRTCDVPIADDSVSRLHAEIAFAGAGRIVLKDCGSSNGTLLIRGDTKMAVQGEEQVFPTDEVRFGGVKLSVAEMLDAINSKHPVPVPASLDLNDPKLTRCACGAMKRRDEFCSACGQASNS
jgi:pSer/pThr/pTyr-binding forkhead associated (FHA) protein